MSDERVEAFRAAVSEGRADEVGALLREDPSLAAHRADGVGAVLLAVFSGRRDVVPLLLDAGAPVGPAEAAALGSVEALERVAAGADGQGGGLDPNHPGPMGWTPLHLAAFVGAGAATRWLLDRGGDPGVRSLNREANTPLHAALAGAGEAEVVALLLEAGADPAAGAALGVTPLHLAASRGDAAAVDRLLEAGAEPAPMEDGRLPSALARERGHPDLGHRLEELEAQGA